MELSAEQTTLTITLALDSTNGTVVDGASRTATISGANYGTLSAISNDTSVATASINGNILTVTGTITSGTKNAIITVSGSEGGTATYTVTAHRHTGNSSSGGGCYTNASTSSYTYYCSGCQTSTYTYYCSGCSKQRSCDKWVTCSNCGGCTSYIYVNGTYKCTNFASSTYCGKWNETTYCPGHTGTSTYCSGHTGYTTTYSKTCGF